MAIVSTNFPSAIGLFHNEDGGRADWSVLIEEFTAEIILDTPDPISYADRVFIDLRVGGEKATVGDFYTDNDPFFDWYSGGSPGTFTLSGKRDDDSSRIVAQHDATVYDGLPPGEGEWVVRKSGFNTSEVIHREPVTVVPRWVSPNVLSIGDCGASDTDLRPGDETTITATVSNPGFDPMAGDAVVFVGGSESSVPFTVPPRGEVSVEATFEVEGSGQMQYGIDLRGVGHNY